VSRELWRSLLARSSELSRRRGTERYAVIENDVHESPEPPLLRAMVAVSTFDALPAWCERFTVEPGRYAVFEHRGSPRDLTKTVARIYAEWSPHIAGLFERNLEILVYPSGYDAMDPTSAFEYWLPIP
jgi:AraC family transcriptional regulator